MQVQSGDVIIAASDGLWDNARDEEVLQTLTPVTEDPDQVRPALPAVAWQGARYLC